MMTPVGVLRIQPDEVVLTADGWHVEPGRTWTEIDWIETESA